MNEPVRLSETAPSSGTADYGVTLGNLKALREAAREKLKAQQAGQEKLRITEENLHEFWQEIVDELTVGKALYKSAVMAGDIFFQDHIITVRATIVGFDFLKNERPRLLDFFKLKYRDENINVVFELKEEEAPNPGERVLSSKEIFEKMAEKNPALRSLKDSLGLDLEY